MPATLGLTASQAAARRAGLTPRSWAIAANAGMAAGEWAQARRDELARSFEAALAGRP